LEAGIQTTDLVLLCIDPVQVHGRGKLIPTDGDEEFEDNALLRRTAQLTVRATTN
jgi:succinyl-CoA synthetase beta subunit